MTRRILTRYDFLQVAEQARDAMLSAGFSAGQLELSSLADEAGPSQGNFALDYKDTDRPNDRSPLDRIFKRDDTNEGLERQKVAWRGNCLLLIRPDGDAQARIAAQIARRFGALVVE